MSETIRRDELLEDLGQLVGTVKNDVSTFPKTSEYSLSSEFKSALEDAFSGYSFDFNERTVRVGTPQGQNIYVTNQSIALSERLMAYCEAIGKYRSLAREVLNLNAEEFKNLLHSDDARLQETVFTSLRDGTDAVLKAKFGEETKMLFMERYHQDEELAMNNAERIIKFVSDYDWWCGGKQISRGTDWSISPISTLLNMPQNDSNFIARAVSKATEDSEYREAFEHAVEHEWSHEENDTQEINYKTGLNLPYERNRILFGAPGTGKSHTLNEEAKKLLGTGNEADYERVTFHPDYSYANFVGTYKPVMVGNAEKPVDKDTEYVLSVLNNKSMSAQEKYDTLFDIFKGDGLTRLPILLGLYTDEAFKTRKQDGSDAANDNIVERNHGRAIRKYVHPVIEGERKNDIAYEYVPGPFMRVYVKALKNARTGKPRPHLLIIEEINRANVAAVFGDVFQLLDRDEDNVSEYPIQASEDIRKYLAKELGGNPDDYDRIRIPDNMFIWATMNSADQGVFPMDTAFKRRWDFTYLGIDDHDNGIQGKYVLLGDDKSQKVEWNKLRKAINKFLANEKINEDKQMGPYFLSAGVVAPTDGNEIDREKFIRVFKNKVIMYLFEDAARQKRAKLFEGCFQNSNRYSEICREFEEKGIGIFHHDIQIDAAPEDVKNSVPGEN